MSRYRPPRPAGTPLITPEGEARLRAELHELWNVRRPQVTQSVSEAAAQGDRSENAEYTYGKKMLREIDSRVRFLRKRLENCKVVSERPADPNKVYFGAWVTLEDEDGEQARTASSARTSWTCATTTSASTRRWPAPWWARSWTPR
jgi:transcription elongation factor GreB